MHKILLGNYKGLKITPATMYTDNDLELAIIESLTRLTNQWAKNNMPAELGDEVIVTLQAECEALFVPELSKSNFRYSVGDPAMLEQFKQVVSKKAGESFKMLGEKQSFLTLLFRKLSLPAKLKSQMKSPKK